MKESEENLSIILNSIGDGVIATDLHGNITRLNPKAEELTGWTQEDARGLPLTEVFHIIDAKTGEPAFNPVHHVLKTGKGIGLANDTALIARDGTRYQIGDSAAPIRDSKGKITGVVMVFSDVSEQYAAREALKKSEARYRTIVENTNDALFVRDFKGEILDLNDTACRLLGYKREELLGINLAAIRSPEEQARTSERLGQLLKENKLLFEGTLMHKNGSPIPVEISQAVISREGDGLIQSFARDITGRKRNEQQIAAYTAKLEGLYQKLEAEMNKAREVHKRTLPKELPVIKGISLAAHYQPAEELGGDFYDVVQRGKKLVIYLSDVTGHGADGAMLSVFVKHTIKGYLSFAPEEGIRPEKILRYLSAQFHQKNLPPEYFICTFLAVLDLETKELTYTAAGFQDAPLVRLGNGKRLKLMSKGLFLSPAFPDELLNLQEKSIHLTPGTTVFFNTDGLTEQGAKNTYYGTRLPAVFYENCHLPPSLLAQTVCEDFRNFNGGSLQGNDDITFLILQIDPNPKKIKRLELSSDFAELEHLRTKVSGILGNHKEVDLFLACLHELASNAIEHGNRLDKEKTVSVEIVITDRFIQGSVEDQGEGFNWRNQIDKPLELEGVAERGRGIAMARICSRHLLYNDKGNRATFILKGLKEDNNHAS
ncbi:MAG: PAS domain S-box protein [Firmicutes bacterium]|nr:PAS domain S-box protein [Bacillota bacterium]